MFEAKSIIGCYWARPSLDDGKVDCYLHARDDGDAVRDDGKGDDALSDIYAHKAARFSSPEEEFQARRNVWKF